MASDIRIRLGERIRELRLQRSWRQIDLAVHADLSKTHIHDIETGKRQIGIEALERIAVALDMNPSDLLRQIKR
jgi:transcriptional regulator with XRE-family HTH domain